MRVQHPVHSGDPQLLMRSITAGNLPPAAAGFDEIVAVHACHFEPLNLRDASKHHFASVKHDLILF